jgi:hypothetical protein
LRELLHLYRHFLDGRWRGRASVLGRLRVGEARADVDVVAAPEVLIWVASICARNVDVSTGEGHTPASRGWLHAPSALVIMALLLYGEHSCQSRWRALR